MDEPTFSVPMTCPSCTREGLHSLATATTAAALLSGRRLRLRCHHCPAHWEATAIERDQIREYLAVLAPRERDDRDSSGAPRQRDEGGGN